MSETQDEPRGSFPVRGVAAAVVVAGALGWAYGSLIVGAGALAAGILISVLYARHAAAGDLGRRPR